MIWWSWALLGFFVWVILVLVFLRLNYLFWARINATAEMKCLGCTRGWIVYGCPVHDTARKFA